jgi:signal transduction histidine kinase
VFDRFYHGHHARTRAVPGIGLGVTVARTMAFGLHMFDFRLPG